MPSPEMWFAPNVGSVDLIDLFQHPERWAGARSIIRALQLHAQHVTLDGPDPVVLNGPNHWTSLSAADAWNGLENLGVRLSIEIDAIQWTSGEGGPTAHDNRLQALSVIERVAAAGGQVASIAIDEPLWGGLSPEPESGASLSFDETVALTAQFVRGVRGKHPQVEIGLIEAYPVNDAATIIRFIESIRSAGVLPAFVHLDVDRHAIDTQEIPEPTVSADLKKLGRQCAVWGVPFGLILFGQRVETPPTYRFDVLRWLKQIHKALGTWPDRLIVQSFEEADHLKALPYNLPDTDAFSHTGLVRAVQEQVAALG